MDNNQSRRIASASIAVAIALLLALTFLALFFMIGQPFGSLNDAGIGLGALLSMALAWTFYPIQRARAPRASLVGLVAAHVGAVIAAVGSVLVISGITGFVLSGWFTAFGYALIGLWLILLCEAARRAQWFSQRVTNFGLATGAVMVIGLVAVSGIVTKTDSMAELPWHLAVSEISFLGSLILFPAWCFWLWRHLSVREGGRDAIQA